MAPLSKPYELSFTSVLGFDTVWVRIEDESGRVGLGEAVALPGYAWETADSIASTVAAVMEGAARLTAAALEDRCRKLSAEHPFAVSAVMTALEFPDLLSGHQPQFSFPLNIPVSGETPLHTLRGQVKKHLDEGYTYIKVKIGRDLEAECAAARCVLAEQFDKPFSVVFDANQAYSTQQARRFADALAALPRARLLWLEQPVDRSDWAAMTDICRYAQIPIVLDEPIYNAEHIDRAAELGAHGIKLKGFKHTGSRHALELARRARGLGLNVVFGNGVATDIGNLAEILILESGGALFSPPGECSGFAKLVGQLLPGALEVGAGGKIVAPLSADALSRLVNGFRG